MSTPTRGMLAVLVGLALGACTSPIDAPHPLPGPPLLTDSIGGGSAYLLNFDADGNRLTRFDTEGKALDAHGGEVRRFGEMYYLYGESYACGYEWKVGASPFCGFRVYRSPDLVHWTDEGLLFEADNWYWQSRCNGWTYGCYRPHMLHDAARGKYVLWFNSSEVTSSFHVLESDSPTGPFVDLPEPTMAANADAPPGVNNGDQNLFLDDDGRAYVTYTDWNAGGDILVERLTPDFRSGTGEHVRLGLRAKESPSLFKRGDRYYITMSDPNCGYCTTGTSYVVAPTPLGPWSPPRKISENSCGGQPGHVAALPAVGGGTWYLYQSDLWNDGAANEATADLYWGMLQFREDGTIADIDCAPVTVAPVVVAGAAPSALPPPRARLVCDVGIGRSRREVQREIRFTPSTDRQLRSVTLTTFLYGWPDAPLALELRTPGDGRLVERVELDPEVISWSPRPVTVSTGLRLAANTTYALRLRAPATRGCYGVAFRDDLPLAADAPRAYVSADGGVKWREERGRTLMIDLELE